MQKIEVKKIDSANVELYVEVTGERVKNKFEDVFKKIAKDAKVPGFRPGHAPRDILEKNYSSFAHQQVLKEMIPEVYSEAIEKENISVIELPQISDVKLDRTKLEFKATVEIRPEIKLKDYKGLSVSFKKIIVGLDEIKRNIDSLKESRKIDNLDDYLAKSMGYPSLQELEKAVERQIFLQKEQAQRQRIENEIIENLAKDLDFKVPQSLVIRQLEDLVKHAKIDMSLNGQPREKIDEQEKEIRNSLQPEAGRQVRVYLVLSEIAKRENIPIDDTMPRRVIELLLREANWQVS
jgi:FKBP-type peptidyl-prolyl cis-trans isomerase (trigger factor)